MICPDIESVSIPASFVASVDYRDLDRFSHLRVEINRRMLQVRDTHIKPFLVSRNSRCSVSIVVPIDGSALITVKPCTVAAERHEEGERLFEMAPLHHHFEKRGWAESKIIMRFWILGILCSLVAFSTLKIR